MLISLGGTNPIKITDFLNKITSVYLVKNLEKKNEQAFNTVNFIDLDINKMNEHTIQIIIK